MSTSSKDTKGIIAKVLENLGFDPDLADVDLQNVGNDRVLVIVTNNVINIGGNHDGDKMGTRSTLREEEKKRLDDFAKMHGWDKELEKQDDN